jgi:hypothetical protein
MKVEYSEVVPKKKWKELLSISKESYFFHTPEWIKILEETHDFKNASRLYKAGDSEILIPMVEKKKFGLKILNSLPSGYGGIFYDVKPPSEILQDILVGVSRFPTVYLNILFPPNSQCTLDFKHRNIFEIQSIWNYTHILSLEKGYDYIWENLYHKSKKRDIRRAERSGLEVIEANSINQLKLFYEMYRKESLERWGCEEPPDSWSFFDNLFKYGKEYLTLMLAELNGEIIGGLMISEYGKNAFTHYSSFVYEYRRYRPVDFLIDLAVRNCYENGVTILNLGSSGNLRGLVEFKEKFGARKVELKRYKIVNRISKLLVNKNLRLESPERDIK